MREVNKFARNAKVYADMTVYDSYMILKRIRGKCLNTLMILPNMERARELRRCFNNIEEVAFNLAGPSRDILGILEYDSREIGWLIISYEDLANNIDRFAMEALSHGYVEEEEAEEWRRRINARDSSIQTYDDADDIADSEDEEGYMDSDERPHVEIQDLMSVMMSQLEDDCITTSNVASIEMTDCEVQEGEADLRHHHTTPLLTQDQHQEMVPSPTESENNNENDPLLQSFINSDDGDDILLNMII